MSAYRIANGSTHGLADTEEFLQLLNKLEENLPESVGPFFEPDSDLIVARAPGRLDVMGGISDYSGSLVLQLPIAAAAHVALQLTNDRRLRILSLPAESSHSFRLYETTLEELIPKRDYATVRDHFASNAKYQWAAYVAGAFMVLAREKDVEFRQGANILIRSLVPEGKGVSSSAALEVASMKAIDGAYQLQLSGTELAVLCQTVENQIAGAPCGVMDQMTSACGESNRLLELLCQPCDLFGTLALPAELELWGVDSGVRHSVGGSAYTEVRTAAFMGYRIIAEMAQRKVTAGSGPGKVSVADPKWNGYLANVTPEEFRRNYLPDLPAKLRGGDFLQRYHGITDKVTTVKEDASYSIEKATAHPIYENERVKQFANALRNWTASSQPTELGELMFASHESYSACGLGSPETDVLIRLIKELRQDGLFGARITGGGSGGTVAVLGQRGRIEIVQRLCQMYQQETGRQPTIISGSSPGAIRFGSLRLSVN